ncbi:LCP family protein [Falsibacillus albus]|nr:LCP family protein [Falsibacillus albus]
MKKGLKIAIAIFTVLSAAACVFFYQVVHQVDAFFENTYKPLPTEVKSETEVKKEIDQNEKQPGDQERKILNILLMGVDERPGDKGRPDVMVLAQIDPKEKKTTLISIPRDTKVHIPGREGFTKLNHSYTYGDVPLTVQTIQNLFGITIDYYGKVNMNGFEQILNDIGEIDVKSDIDFTFNGHHFVKGMQTLEPNEALDFVRMRKQDPKGDAGRNERQRAVMEGIAKKMLNHPDISTLLHTAGKFSSYLEWNLTEDDLKRIYQNDLDAVRNIEEKEIKGENKYEDGAWYFIIDQMPSLKTE